MLAYRNEFGRFRAPSWFQAQDRVCLGQKESGYEKYFLKTRYVEFYQIIFYPLKQLDYLLDNVIPCTQLGSWVHYPKENSAAVRPLYDICSIL